MIVNFILIILHLCTFKMPILKKNALNGASTNNDLLTLFSELSLVRVYSLTK